MEHFHLEHPDNEVFLCERQGCNGIADYLEVENGQEVLLCSAHTSSRTYAACLPPRVPSTAVPHRSRPAV